MMHFGCEFGHNLSSVFGLTSVSENGLTFHGNSELFTFAFSLFIPLLLYNSTYQIMLLGMMFYHQF